MSKKTADKIYTHDEAMQIVEMFENILHENNIRVPSPEDDQRDEDNGKDDTGLYGSTYSDLLDQIEDRLVEILGEHGSDTKVITGEFSGTI
jgi:hypothetical protein